MDNTNNCPIKGCFAKWIITSIPVFIFLVVAGYVVHHLWLKPLYEQTASLWRPMDEMKELFPLLLAYYAALSLLITALFCKIKKAKMEACAATGTDCKIGGPNCPIKCGVCFGIIVGLLLGVSNAACYIWMPIPSELAIKWLLAWVGEGIGIGIILGLVCHKKGGAA